MSLRPDQLGKPLKVKSRIAETADAVSLVLEIPDALTSTFRYQAGQFVTFFMNINGETLNRSYSLSSSPLTDREFKVTVKKIKGGRGSTYLCDQVREGETLLTAPPTGFFFKASALETPAHFVLIAAGSGITPVFSILKTVLTHSKNNRVTLIYSNRSEEAIIYRAELDQWAKEHADRLEIIYRLTKPGANWTGATGRTTAETVEPFAKANDKSDVLPRQFYLCGPKEFMDNVRQGLIKGGAAPDQIHAEDFAVSLHKPVVETNDAWTFIGNDQPTEIPERIIALINGETVEVAAKQDLSILETLLEAGAEPPYSCMDGACMACMAKIQEGRVYQEDPGILTDENIAAGESLTCQAKPLSRIVRVSFDDL